MELSTLGNLLVYIYIILYSDLKEPRALPTHANAVRVIRRRWVDTKSKGTVYHVGAFLDTHAPDMPAGQRIQLIKACLKSLRQRPTLMGVNLTMQNLPGYLRPFVR